MATSSSFWPVQPLKKAFFNATTTTETTTTAWSRGHLLISFLCLSIHPAPSHPSALLFFLLFSLSVAPAHTTSPYDPPPPSLPAHGVRSVDPIFLFSFIDVTAPNLQQLDDSISQVVSPVSYFAFVGRLRRGCPWAPGGRACTRGRGLAEPMVEPRKRWPATGSSSAAA